MSEYSFSAFFSLAFVGNSYPHSQSHTLYFGKWWLVASTTPIDDNKKITFDRFFFASSAAAAASTCVFKENEINLFALSLGNFLGLLFLPLLKVMCGAGFFLLLLVLRSCFGLLCFAACSAFGDASKIFIFPLAVGRANNLLQKMYGLARDNGY